MSDVLEEPTFRAFPKLPRLQRPTIITEKLDGTNACVGVLQDGTVWAQSRKRIIAPGKTTDNYGFAGWVAEHEDVLRDLGPGYHYGEWWGNGIQRGYDLDEKRFSLFNVETELTPELTELVHKVPVLARSDRLHTGDVDHALWELAAKGSQAAPGYMNPEGIVVYHTAARRSFKVTLEDDHKPKGAA